MILCTMNTCHFNNGDTNITNAGARAQDAPEDPAPQSSYTRPYCIIIHYNLNTIYYDML